ncbi:MAG TPA: four-helix bundle copper-binding protein [Planctomycetota bacterium]|nr:four-helix bundle copper-binding protein [Planctomycetota bacterium]
MPHNATPTKEMQRCIDVCQECHVTCLESVRHCLLRGGTHAAAEHLQLLLGCAEICRTNAAFLALGLAQHGETCRVCADVCLESAESCARFGDDEELQLCEETCRRCAAICRSMAEQPAAR